jgi:energy-coupling factor transporter transmembrane protein EcfT
MSNKTGILDYLATGLLIAVIALAFFYTDKTSAIIITIISLAIFVMLFIVKHFIKFIIYGIFVAGALLWVFWLSNPDFFSPENNKGFSSLEEALQNKDKIQDMPIEDIQATIKNLGLPAVSDEQIADIVEKLKSGQL